MKKKLFLLCLLAGLSGQTLAHAQTENGYSSLLKSKVYGNEIKTLAKKNNLPSWILSTPTDTGNYKVTLNKKPAQIVTACKPHDCATQTIAILLDTQNHITAGVLATYSEATHTQTLKWLNTSPAENIDGTTILYGALNGSLANHPGNFNF